MYANLCTDHRVYMYIYISMYASNICYKCVGINRDISSQLALEDIYLVEETHVFSLFILSSMGEITHPNIVVYKPVNTDNPQLIYILHLSNMELDEFQRTICINEEKWKSGFSLFLVSYIIAHTLIECRVFKSAMLSSFKSKVNSRACSSFVPSLSLGKI